jgi:energy-coupling factor transport system ATP-binding protein
VSVAGRTTSAHRPRDLARTVGFVPQNPLSSFVTDTVEDEIAYGMEQLGMTASTMRKRVEETLDLLGIADLRRRHLMELSGGQQQRVAIASVLAAQPRVLVLDEPTSALDPTAAHDVLSAVETLVQDVGLTVVLAEHRLERVTDIADQMLWLPGDGRVISGTPSQVLAVADLQPPLSRLAHRVGWSSVPVSVRDARRRVQQEGITATLPEASSDSLPEASSSTVADGPAVLVRTTDLGVHYGETVALSGVCLELRAGSVTALMGRNGSGKSSMLWALAGATPSTGQIEVDGTNPAELDPSQARQEISLVPQTAADLLYLPTVAAECEQADHESSRPEGTCRQRLDDLGLALDPRADPHDLSEGQRLGLVLAIQLTADPRVVLLDEPTRGLDYTAKDRLAGIVRRLRDAGSCVVVSTHDVEFAATLCDRTVLLAGGEVIAEGSTREVITSSPAYSPQLAKVFHPAPVLRVEEVTP